jgi:hypothetical protein
MYVNKKNPAYFPFDKKTGGGILSNNRVQILARLSHMKKAIIVTFLLVNVIQIIAMDQPNPTIKTKGLRPNIEAMFELTDKSIGCSEYKQERDRKYSKEKDIERQNRYKVKIAIFLDKMNQKYPSTENKPVWLAENHINAEAQPFPSHCTDAKDFIDTKKPIYEYNLRSHCNNLNKMEIGQLSKKDAALLKFVHNSVEDEDEWWSWCSRKFEGGKIFFEKPIAFEFKIDASGKPVKMFNKKENAWENIFEKITVQQHLNSPHFKYAREHGNLFHPINILNALENESYHKELMFLQRQSRRMQLFNTIDKEKMEKELDKAWEKRNSELQKIDSEWNSIFSWWQRTFNHDQYKRRIEYRKLVCKENYKEEHENASQNLTQAYAAQKRLEQEIRSFQNPQNREAFTCSGIIGKQNFADVQRSREQCLKE